MGETTKTYETACATDGSKISYERWPAQNVENDLISQGGIDAHYLNVKNEGFHGYLEVHNGSHNGIGFSMRWEDKNFLVVKLEEDDFELIEAFSKVLEQKPFVRYDSLGAKNSETRQVIYEWDSVNPNKRYGALQAETQGKDTKISNLEKLV